MTNESPFRKNRAYYIGVVLTVLEGILSGCSYLSVYIVLTALASGTITAGMVGAVTAGLAVIFLLRLVIYSTGYTQVQIGGAAVSKRLRLLLGDKLKKIPLARFTQGQVGQYVNTMTSDVGSYEKHRFFTDRLIAAGVDPATAERDACRIEHVISDESFERLKAAAKPEL